jgi:hypothetical protein
MDISPGKILDFLKLKRLKRGKRTVHNGFFSPASGGLYATAHDLGMFPRA